MTDSGFGGSGWGFGPWGDGSGTQPATIPPDPPVIDYILARGTTPWVQLPVWPRGIVVGDALELYETQYNIVSREFSIVGLVESLRVIQISPEIESDITISFTDGTTPPPFGRIRVGKVYNFNLLKEALLTWLARTENKAAYFGELARLANALIANSNPSLASTNEFNKATQKLAAWLTVNGQQEFGVLTSPAAQLGDTLTEALSGYSVDAVTEIDTLISTYRQRGADRAVDILLEGRYRDFFGLGSANASYAGELAEQMRGVARELLPISRYDRQSTTEQSLLASYPEKDPEYTLEASDEELVVDPDFVE